MEPQKHTRPEIAWQQARQLAASAASAPLPTSLNWIYGLGFKIGIFLILKSFLVIRYLQLSATGCIIVLSQCALALVLIVLGVIMQEAGSNRSRGVLTAVTAGYGLTTVIGGAICYLKDVCAWEFFQPVQNANWFVDFFTGAAKSAKEITLSLVFWDTDLWIMFCCVLFLLTLFYMLAHRDHLN